MPAGRYLLLFVLACAGVFGRAWAQVRAASDGTHPRIVLLTADLRADSLATAARVRHAASAARAAIKDAILHVCVYSDALIDSPSLYAAVSASNATLLFQDRGARSGVGCGLKYAAQRYGSSAWIVSASVHSVWATRHEAFAAAESASVAEREVVCAEHTHADLKKLFHAIVGPFGVAHASAVPLRACDDALVTMQTGAALSLAEAIAQVQEAEARVGGWLALTAALRGSGLAVRFLTLDETSTEAQTHAAAQFSCGNTVESVAASEAFTIFRVSAVDAHVSSSRFRHSGAHALQHGDCTLWWPLPGAKIQSFSNLYYIDLMLNCSAISHAGPCRAQIGFGRFSVAYELSERELRGKAVCVMAETYEQGMTRLVIEIFKQQEVMSRFSLEVDVEKQWKATAGICDDTPRLYSRREMGGYLDMLHLSGHGVEIGVQQGTFASSVISKWHASRYLLVDPWMHDRSGCDESVRFSQHRQEQYLNDTLQNLKQIGEEGKRAVIMRMTSLRAAQLIADESLDFVYIDALHDYVSTLQDIEAWWPKLKSGGLMAGHDYLHSITFYGDNVITVAPAVQKFASEHSRQEQVSIPDFTWYFRK